MRSCRWTVEAPESQKILSGQHEDVMRLQVEAASTYLSVSPSVCLFILLSAHRSLSPSICQSISLSVHLFVSPPLHQSLSSSVCLYICLSVRPSVSLSSLLELLGGSLASAAANFTLLFDLCRTQTAIKVNGQGHFLVPSSPSD